MENMMDILPLIFSVFVIMIMINFIKEQLMIYGNTDLKSQAQSPDLLEKTCSYCGMPRDNIVCTHCGAH